MDAERKGALGPAEVALVVCDRPESFALVRANRAGKSAALIHYKDFEDRAAFDQALRNVLNAGRIDLVVLAGFMRILGSDLVRAYQGRMINVHPSLLPAFRGAHAIRDAVDYGAKVTGVTVHFVTPELDAGPVILQEAVTVRPDDTAETLAGRIHAVEHRLYPLAARRWAEGRVSVRGRRVTVR